MAEELEKALYGGELPEEVLPTIHLLQKYGFDLSKVNYVNPEAVIPSYPSSSPPDYLLAYHEDGIWFKILQYMPQNQHRLSSAFLKWSVGRTLESHMHDEFLSLRDKGFLLALEEVFIEARALFNALYGAPHMFERFFALRYGQPIGTSWFDQFSYISQFPPSKLIHLMNPEIPLQTYSRLAKHPYLPPEEYNEWYNAPDDWIKSAWQKK